jgi:hypothetical protein
MAKLILDVEGRLVAVESDKRGVVWPIGSMSLKRFVEAVNLECLGVTIEVRR